MSLSSITFTHPECVALNRKGELSPRQRKRNLLNVVFLLLFIALVAVLAAVCLYVGKTGMAAILAGGVILMAFQAQTLWRIHRDPKPQIVVKRGLLQNINRIPYGRGGVVGIGQDKVLLRKEQLFELRYGHVYEIFVMMPYDLAISAEAVDL